MTILLHKLYSVNVTTKGEGVKNARKCDHVVYERPLANVLLQYILNEIIRKKQ